MATFDSKLIVDKFIAGNGHIEEYGDGSDNPDAIRIVEYTNFEGRQAYGVVFQGDYDVFRYERETAFVRNPKVIFDTSMRGF